MAEEKPTIEEIRKIVVDRTDDVVDKLSALGIDDPKQVDALLDAALDEVAANARSPRAKRILARVRKFVKNAEKVGISPDELPAILDAGFGVVENAVVASRDGRISLREVAQIWKSLDLFFEVVANARKT